MKTTAAKTYDELDDEEKVDASYLAGAYHAFTAGRVVPRGDDLDDDEQLMVVEAANWMRAARVLGYIKPNSHSPRQREKGGS